MDSDLGKDLERTAMWLAFAWVAGVTFRRKLSRAGEAIWWTILGGAITLGVIVNFITPVPANPPDPGNLGLIWTWVGAGAAVGLLLSLTTWYGAQVRRTRRDNARLARHQRKLQKADMARAEWARKASQS